MCIHIYIYNITWHRAGSRRIRPRAWDLGFLPCWDCIARFVMSGVYLDPIPYPFTRMPSIFISLYKSRYPEECRV